MAYLEPWHHKSGPVVPSKKLSNQIRRWSKKSIVSWKHDGLRHSYASYRLALLKDIGELALEMGNSPKIIHDDYLDLKHEDEAEQWFALRPLRPANVLEMSA